MEEERDDHMSNGSRLDDLIEEHALAKALGLGSVDPIRTIRYEGQLPYIKIGRAVFYYEPTLMRYLLDNAEGHEKKRAPQTTTEG